jgi:cytochrome c
MKARLLSAAPLLGAAAIAVGVGTVTTPSLAQDGQSVFRRVCSACHTVEPGKNRLGPSLAGIVGRKAGTVPGFEYSEANKTSSVVWDEAQLDKYLADPKGFMPGNKMVYAGLKNDADRKAVIDYLREAK